MGSGGDDGTGRNKVMEKREVKIHGIYKHFKNKYYIVEDVAFHSETKEEYVVYRRLILLCTDICRRYGKTKLLWLEDKDITLNYSPKKDEMVLTVHRWFARKFCLETGYSGSWAIWLKR